MKWLVLIASLSLLGIGAAAYYGWEARGESGPRLTSVVPAAVGAATMAGFLLSLGLRRTGLQLAFLAALAGIGLGVGRMLPDYLKDTLDTRAPFNLLMFGMIGVCLIEVLAMAGAFLFRKPPVVGGKGGDAAPDKEAEAEGGSLEEAGEMESEKDLDSEVEK
ncbi:MAG TPA: hypothetical protein PLA50_08940 [Bacteroidia bacterium]|nr:hypothetical protein [Bacteroidia bacterium]